MCRMQRFLAVLRSFFHSSLLCTFYCHPSPPTILPSSLISSCHLFLGLPLNLVVPKFIYNTLLGILFSSILCTSPNQRNLFFFNVLLTVHPGMILVNNQLDARFFMYVYFYSLHVSGSHVAIIRRIIVSMQHLVYVTLCRLPSGMQVNLHSRWSSTCLVCRLTCIVDNHLHRVT